MDPRAAHPHTLDGLARLVAAELDGSSPRTALEARPNKRPKAEALHDPLSSTTEASARREVPDGLTLEVCVDSIGSALEAVAGGAHRLEVCANLVDGGTTPSLGLVYEILTRCSVPVHVLVRPRAGDFLYTDAEFQVMKNDIVAFRAINVHGFVLGVLNADGTVDESRTDELCELCHPASVTFHRAIDVCADPLQAVRLIAERMPRVQRVLTSGAAPDAVRGAGLIRDMCRAVQLLHGASGSASNDDTRDAAAPGPPPARPQPLIVMAGGGITQANVAQLVRSTGVREVHASTGRAAVRSTMVFERPGVFMGGEKRNDRPDAEYWYLSVASGKVRAFVDTLQACADSQDKSEHAPT